MPKKVPFPPIPINRDLAMSVKPGEILIDGPTFYVGRAAWLLLAHTAHQDANQWNMACIHFDRSGDVVATDGKRLVTHKHVGQKRADGTCVVSFDLGLEHVTMIRQSIDEYDCVAITCHDDCGYHITATIVHRTPTRLKSVSTVPIPIGDGHDERNFPQYRLVTKTPTGVSAGLWGVDAALLGSMCVDFARVTDGAGIYVRAWSELDPLHLETTHGASWLGVIMPMRI